MAPASERLRAASRPLAAHAAGSARHVADDARHVADDARHIAPLLLLVDDDAAVAWAVRAALEAHGSCRVRAVGSVAAARTCLERETVDAVLTDVRMPGESGLALLEWLREHRPRTPVLVMTAYGGVAAGAPAMDGVAQLLAKPIDLDVLLDAVRRVVGARDARA